MKIFRIINKFISFLYFFLKFRDTKIAFLLSHYHVTFQAASAVKRIGRYLEFTETGNRILVKQAYTYNKELRSLIRVLNTTNVAIIPDDSKNYIALKIN